MRRRIVGRQGELRRIASTLAAARAGSGKAIVVLGDPGVGKTGFTGEAMHLAAAAGMATAHGRPSIIGPAVPYRPVTEALLSLSRTGDLPDLGELGMYGAALARLLSGPSPADPGSAAPHLVIAEAVLRLLGVVGRRRGCLLVFDDMQDADLATLAMLEYVLDNLGPLPVVVLMAVRREGRSPDLAGRMCRRRDAEFLELRPLGRRDVHLLLAAELGLEPADVSTALVDYVAAGGAGLPLVARELTDHLRHHDRDVLRTLPARTAVASYARSRIGRLDPDAKELLDPAAVFGPRFPVAVVQHATGWSEERLLTTLRTDALIVLLRPDGTPGWCAFRHPVAAEAVLADLGASDRARHARRLAQAAADLHPGLPGEWCIRAAELWDRAGEPGEAGRLYCEAGRRALANGTTGLAVTMLTRAHRMLAGDRHCDLHAAVLDLLLPAVAWAGRLNRVPELTTAVDRLRSCDLSASQHLRLSAHLATLASLAGRPADALHHLDAARRLLPRVPTDADVAVVELAAARVELLRIAPGRLDTAAGCARRAADAAQRANLPVLAGQAQLALGCLVQERDETAATAALSDARAVAVKHRLPVLRAAADTYAARMVLRRDGDPVPLRRARAEALRMGVFALVHEADTVLALDEVWRGEVDAALRRVRDALDHADRLGSGQARGRLRLVEAVAHAHRGQRAPMHAILNRLGPHLDDPPGVRSAAYGLARAFCSLLLEDHEAADRELAQAAAYDAENPSVQFCEQRGVVLLTGVLAGRLGWQHLTATAPSAWDRQFAGMARAVLLGRDRRPAEATAAAANALRAGAPYPTARSLCLRLVAPSAHEDGWGEPVDWLRQVETYFHDAGILAPASACRVLLRQMGARVGQRRTGADRVPPYLRRLGMTVREFEVAQLLAGRIANRDIAGRLHISPRTVEKHVASILQKTGHPDRAAFAADAHDLVPKAPADRP